MEQVGLVLDQVHDALELVRLTDRQLDRHRVGAEPVVAGAQRAGEVGVLLVHHVHDHQRRRLLLLQDLPHHFGADLGARVRAQHEDRGVRGRQRAVDVADEVGKAGRVQEVDLVAGPFELGQPEADRDLALDLVLRIVEQGVAVRDPAETRGRLGGEQHGFGEAGLAHAVVGNESNVTNVGGREFLHRPPPRPRVRGESELRLGRRVRTRRGA